MVLASWTAHPARTRPRDTVLVVSVVLLTTGAVMTAFQSLLLAVLAPFILFVSVAPFLLPTRYVLSDWGIEESRLFRHKSRCWGQLRRFSIGRGAALVSPMHRPSYLDRYRGFYLLLDGADRDEVKAILEDRLGDG